MCENTVKLNRKILNGKLKLNGKRLSDVRGMLHRSIKRIHNHALYLSIAWYSVPFTKIYAMLLLEKITHSKYSACEDRKPYFLDLA